LVTPPTAAGRMMIGVLGSLAEYERELVKERTALKRAGSRANGTKFGGHNIPRDDGWPAWLLDHFEGARWVRVLCDDTIAPCSEHPWRSPPALPHSDPSGVKGVWR
jgi:hypothetical protein